MADRTRERKELDLGETPGQTERENSFWNRSVVLMKSTVEEDWLDIVHHAKRKPNYGMRDLKSVLEERALNKLELVGPMVDSYLKNLGLSMFSKLGRSRCTGLMPPINIFIPWVIFRHICMLIVGYDGDMNVSDKNINMTISKYNTAKRVFSPVRIQGMNCLKKRKYKKVLDGGRYVHQLDGRAAVMVTSNSPITLNFDRKRENVCLTFFVQRYDANDMAIDLSLQRLISNS